MQPVHTIHSEAEQMIFPDAITLKILLSGEQTGGTLAIFEDVVEPGVGPGRHIHHHQDETFFFLEGDFIAEVEGKLYKFKPGDVAFIPRGTVHAFKNAGKTPGRLQYVFTPAQSIEQMFRDFYEAMNDGSLSPERMAEISANHGQEFVGPPLD